MPAYFYPVTVTVPSGTRVQFDSDTNGTPATIYPIGSSTPIPNSEVTSDRSGRVPTVTGDAAIVYVKAVDYTGTEQGAVLQVVTGQPISGADVIAASRAAFVAATPPAALTPWYAALANRDNTPAVAVMIGASGTEGQGATDYTKRWTYRMQSSLRYRFPNATTGTGGGIGFLPPKFIATTITQPATITGSLSAIQYGLGRRALILAAAGNAISWTLPTGTTSFDLSYANGPNGTATVAVDGSTVTTLTSSASFADGPIYHATVTAGSAHTVAVTWASGSFPVAGIRAYAGDENCGIHILDAGHYGWNSSQWNFNDNPSGWAWSVSAVQPALINIALGLNDEIASTSSVTFKTNLTTLIAYLRTAPFTAQPAITLDTQYKLQADGTYAEPWANYVAAMQAIAAADPTVTVIDSAARTPAMSPDTYALWNGDGVHPNNKGHALLGEYHAALLAPR